MTSFAAWLVRAMIRVAKLVSDHPKRLGLFALLPLPDIDGSLRVDRIRLRDKLKVDGVGLLTSYDDKWLGDPLFAPVFQELNRRKTVVYTHPLNYGMYGPGGADTNRTISSLLKDGTSTHYPDIKFIFSHGGGFYAIPESKAISAATTLRKGLRVQQRREHLWLNCGAFTMTPRNPRIP